MTRNTVCRRILIDGCAAIALFSPGVAWAADAPPADSGDIIVTAQRRAQRLEDVPMAITAISPAVAEQRGIRNLQDLGQSVAGVQLNDLPADAGRFTRSG